MDEKSARDLAQQIAVQMADTISSGRALSEAGIRAVAKFFETKAGDIAAEDPEVQDKILAAVERIAESIRDSGISQDYAEAVKEFLDTLAIRRALAVERSTERYHKALLGMLMTVHGMVRDYSAVDTYVLEGVATLFESDDISELVGG